MEYLVYIYIIVFCVLPIILLINVSNKKKKEIEELKNTQPKRRFRFIDTFYYSVYRPEFDDGAWNSYFYLIEEINSKKIYAIRGSNYSYKKNGEGSFWIKEELKNYYRKEKEDIFIENYKININDIKSKNSIFDASMLDKAIFIDGFVEFDK